VQKYLPFAAVADFWEKALSGKGSNACLQVRGLLRSYLAVAYFDKENVLTEELQLVDTEMAAAILSKCLEDGELGVKVILENILNTRCFSATLTALYSIVSILILTYLV